jgi:hypothetical protein
MSCLSDLRCRKPALGVASSEKVHFDGNGSVLVRDLLSIQHGRLPCAVNQSPLEGRP